MPRPNAKRKPKVMIVEDEAVIALDIERQLTQIGFTVTGRAETADQALQKIEQESPDIVLMDIHLKGAMDGVQAAGLIRNRYALPVIYLTAYADDETLERAQMTEPFGYIVKPLGKTNLKAVLTIALHKHRSELETQSSRRLLSTILQSLPDAVMVADLRGKVVFLNRAAEQMSGWKLEDAVGEKLAQIALIQDGDGRSLSPELWQRISTEGTLIPLPQDCTLLTKDGARVAVGGALAVTVVDNQQAGLLMTLQDLTGQKREGQRNRQERQMLVAGELAQGVAREFYSLFDLIGNAAKSVSRSEEEAELDLIQNASRVGMGMSTRLLDLHEGHGSAHVVNVKQFLAASQSLLNRLCGKEIRLETPVSADLGYILSTGNHFEQMLVHLLLEGKQRLNGTGTLSLGAEIHTEPPSSGRPGSYVRLFVRAEASPDPNADSEDLLAFGTATPELGLAIVRAIATASEGFTKVTEPSDFVSIIEVFLPRHDSRISAATAANEYSEAILLVGWQASSSESLKRGLGENVLILEAADPDGAAWISELYEGDIDLVIVNGCRLSAEARDRSRDRIQARRPDLPFLFISDNADPLDCAERARQLLNRKTQLTASAAN